MQESVFHTCVYSKYVCILHAFINSQFQGAVVIQHYTLFNGHYSWHGSGGKGVQHFTVSKVAPFIIKTPLHIIENYYDS